MMSRRTVQIIALVAAGALIAGSAATLITMLL